MKSANQHLKSIGCAVWILTAMAMTAFAFVVWFLYEYSQAA